MKLQIQDTDTGETEGLLTETRIKDRWDSGKPHPPANKLPYMKFSLIWTSGKYNIQILYQSNLSDFDLSGQVKVKHDLQFNSPYNC